MTQPFCAYAFRELRTNNVTHITTALPSARKQTWRTHTLLHARTRALSYLLICALVRDVRYQSMSVCVCALSDVAHREIDTHERARTNMLREQTYAHKHSHTHNPHACTYKHTDTQTHNIGMNLWPSTIFLSRTHSAMRRRRKCACKHIVCALAKGAVLMHLVPSHEICVSKHRRRLQSLSTENKAGEADHARWGGRWGGTIFVI